MATEKSFCDCISAEVSTIGFEENVYKAKDYSEK